MIIKYMLNYLPLVDCFKMNKFLTVLYMFLGLKLYKYNKNCQKGLFLWYINKNFVKYIHIYCRIYCIILLSFTVKFLCTIQIFCFWHSSFLHSSIVLLRREGLIKVWNSCEKLRKLFLTLISQLISNNSADSAP